MKIKTSEATPLQLNWLVAKIESVKLTQRIDSFKAYGAVVLQKGGTYSPSSDWLQGGPIIEREDINVNRFTHSEVTESGKEIYRKDGWTAFTTSSAFWITPVRMYGPTPLIAAMRCYCCAKLGYEIEIPEELQPCQQPNL